MELKEVKYILAIEKYQSISKAAKALYISQPSLSKYLQNIEMQLQVKLFNRLDNKYIPTYMGERYLFYAKQIMKYSNDWESEYDDLINHGYGRMTIATPIIRSSSLIAPTLPSFYKKYPNVTINILEDTHFITEHTLQDYSVDMVLYSVYEYPKKYDFIEIGKEEIVMVVSKKNPLSQGGVYKSGFSYPWIDLRKFTKEKFIMLSPTQNTAILINGLLNEYQIEPNVILCTRSNELALRLASKGEGICFAPESYYKHLVNPEEAVCFSIGDKKIISSLIAAYQDNHYLPPYVTNYIAILKDYFKQQTLQK